MSTILDEVCATQLLPCYSALSDVGFGSPALDSMTCIEPVNTGQQHGATSELRYGEICLLFLHWAPLLVPYEQLQANEKKDKMEERWIIPDELQVCETAQPRSAADAQLLRNTYRPAQWKPKELTSRARTLNCQHMESRELNKWLLF